MKYKHLRKVPVLLQLENPESGSISLGMVLAYYKKWIPTEKLNSACRVSKDGTDANNLVDAAIGYGMNAEIKSCSRAELRETDLPVICITTQGRYFVLTGFKGKDYIINEPAKGEMRLKPDEFAKSYSEKIIELSPGDDFVPEGEKRGTFYFLKQSLKGNGKYIVPVMVTCVLAAFAGVMFPVLTRIYTDYILPHSRDDWYVGFIVIFGVMILFQFIAIFLAMLFMKRATGAIAATANTRFMWHLFHLPLEYFTRRQAGDLAGRQENNDSVADILIGQFAPALMNMLMLVFYLIVMLRYSVKLSLIGLATIAINMFTARAISKKRRKIMRVQMREWSRLNATTISGIDMIDTIKASGAENGYFERLAGIHANMSNARVRFNTVKMYLGTVPALVEQISASFILLLGLYTIMKGDFTPGILLAFQAYLTAFMNPVNHLLLAGEQLMEMSNSMERINDVLETPTDPLTEIEDDPEEIDKAEKLTGNIEMRNVSYGYPGTNKPLIENFNLTLTPGKRVAFVGGSGSGKSTLAKLLTGLYQPWSGEVLYDGKPIDKISPSIFKSSVSMVNQEVVLFHDTIANNIKMWDDTIDDISMILAARDAEIHASILERKGGYRRLIEEGGKDMSGGERQRIEIARVLAGEPSIIIMDEATAALDARTEYKVSKYIKDRGITSIIVAHRLSTIRDCDEIIVMDHGKVMQRGTHDELIKQDGLYKQLVMTQ